MRTQDRGTKSYWLRRLGHALVQACTPFGREMAAFVEKSDPDRPIALVIDDQVPQFDRHAGAMGMRDYLLLMNSIGFKVVFYAADRVERSPYGDAIRQAGITVVPTHTNLGAVLCRYRSRIAFTWLSRPGPARKHINQVRSQTDTPILYCGRDLHFLRTRRRKEFEANVVLQSEAIALEKVERRLLEMADVSLTFSEVEKSIINEIVPRARVRVVAPYVLQARAQPKPPKNKSIIFVGGFRHSPNPDGVLWFLNQIWGRIHDACPDATLTIVGEEPTSDILDWRSDQVRIPGHVESLDMLFAESRVSIAPLRYGAGVKGKIVTAMSYGVPVVSTGIGVEGMRLIDGQNVLVGDTSYEFAEHVLRVMNDDDLWVRLSIGGLSYIDERYSEHVVMKNFQSVLSDAGIALPRGDRTP